MADTRPSKASGVMFWRSVVVLMTHRMGPAPITKNDAPASQAEGSHTVNAIISEAMKALIGPMAIKVPKRTRLAMGPANNESGLPGRQLADVAAHGFKQHQLFNKM